MARPFRLVLVAIVISSSTACNDDRSRGPGGDVDGGPVAGALPQAPECALPFPAFPCDGDPMGTWNLVSVCASTYADCPEESATITGTAEATLVIAESTYDYGRSFDIQERVIVPVACLTTDCRGIDCIAVDDTCVCNSDESSGGGGSGRPYTPSGTGRVALDDDIDPIDFCAGPDRADSIGSRRLIWERVASP